MTTTNANGRVLKSAPGFAGKEGKALIANNEHGLRNDNVFIPTEVKMITELTDIPFRKGLDKVILSNGKVVALVGKSYGHLDNLHFFGQVENALLEANIKYMTRSINIDDSKFSVEYILNDESMYVDVKNDGKGGKDMIRPMMRFINSYDGKTKAAAYFGLFREVCKNGLHVAVSNIGFSYRHRKDIEEVVLPSIGNVIEQFKNNEYYEIRKKFQVLEEKVITNLKDYVKYICDETEIFKYEMSDKNPEPSKNARDVMSIALDESRKLGTPVNSWLLFNGFNSVLFNSLKKPFDAQRKIDQKIFNTCYELATN